MRVIIVILTCMVAVACSSSKTHTITAYNDAVFAVKPHIITEGGQHYLAYKINPEKIYGLRKVLESSVANGKLYFYFIGNLSFKEYEDLVKRPLGENEKYAAANSIYWLNPDGEKIHLEVSASAKP